MLRSPRRFRGLCTSVACRATASVKWIDTATHRIAQTNCAAPSSGPLRGSDMTTNGRRQKMIVRRLLRQLMHVNLPQIHKRSSRRSALFFAATRCLARFASARSPATDRLAGPTQVESVRRVAHHDREMVRELAAACPTARAPHVSAADRQWARCWMARSRYHYALLRRAANRRKRWTERLSGGSARRAAQAQDFLRSA